MADANSEAQTDLKTAGMKSARVFEPLSADNDESHMPTEIDSLCMSCQEQGVTKLLLTKIPFFKEVIVGSFECSHCGFKDSQVNSAGAIQEKGTRVALQVSVKEDLNRQIIKSETAVVKIPHVELEIPGGKGCFTTIEGIINTTCEELSMDQPKRRLLDPETAEKIDAFIKRLGSLLDVNEPFQVIVDDVTGNSFIENPRAPAADPLLYTVHYNRSKEQNEELGIEDGSYPEPQTSQTPAAGEPDVPNIDMAQEVLSFPTNCTRCNAPCQTNMKLVDIPHFKQIVIMALNCESCGCRDNEVKSASGIEDKGCRMTLNIRDKIDLSRDVLKSDSAACEIPELEISLEPGTLGGKFTTVEGLLRSISDQLKNTNFTFSGGDSSKDGRNDRMERLYSEIEKTADGEKLNVTLVIDDAAGNSYVQDIYSPEEDPCLTIEHYIRTTEQNDELGISGMVTEKYENQ